MTAKPLKIERNEMWRNLNGDTEFLATRGHRTGGATAILKTPHTRYTVSREMHEPRVHGAFNTVVPTHDESGTPTLFAAEHTPPKIDHLYSHRASRGDVATLLGAISVHSQKQFGQIPVASTDLTDKSAKIVSKANAHLGRKSAKSSLAPIDPRSSVLRMHNSVRLAHSVDQENVHTLSSADVHEGHMAVRSLFQNNHPRLSKQFSQPELPST